MPDSQNGWGEWSRHVLLELKRLNAEIKDTRKEVRKNHDMILSHRLIAAMISAATSLVTAGIVAYFAMHK